MRIPCEVCGKGHNRAAFAQRCARSAARKAKRRRAIVRRHLPVIARYPGGVLRETLAEHQQRGRREDALGGTAE